MDFCWFSPINPLLSEPALRATLLQARAVAGGVGAGDRQAGTCVLPDPGAASAALTDQSLPGASQPSLKSLQVPEMRWAPLARALCQALSWAESLLGHS